MSAFRFDYENLPANADLVPMDDIEEEFQAPEFIPDFSHIVIIDNIPVVDQNKFDKLNAVLKKITGQHAAPKLLHMPKGKDSKTLGFCFVVFENAKDAQTAIKGLNGHRMDKSHVLEAHPFEDVTKYEDVPDEFDPPPQDEYVEKEHLRSWLSDAKARDQFITIVGDDVAVWWNRKSEAPELIHHRQVVFYTNNRIGQSRMYNGRHWELFCVRFIG